MMDYATHIKGIRCLIHRLFLHLCKCTNCKMVKEKWRIEDHAQIEPEKASSL